MTGETGVGVFPVTEWYFILFCTSIYHFYLLTLNMFKCYKLGPNIVKQINMFTDYNNDYSTLCCVHFIINTCFIVL